MGLTQNTLPCTSPLHRSTMLQTDIAMRAVLRSWAGPIVPDEVYARTHGIEVMKQYFQSCVMCLSHSSNITYCSRYPAHSLFPAGAINQLATSLSTTADREEKRTSERDKI